MFSRFSALPVEIRLRIWQYAAPQRPRVIQVEYDFENDRWRAVKDGLGGLPSIVHVSREAREEALKPYQLMFDAYVDPQVDTIFFSDPIFTVRKPRSMFMNSKYANVLRNVAFTSDIYTGLLQASDQFPGLCEGPMKIMRRLEVLSHFTIAIADDGAGFDYGDGEDEESEDEEVGEVWESEMRNEELGDDLDASELGDDDSVTVANAGDDAEQHESGDENEAEVLIASEGTFKLEEFLDSLDKEAMESMSKGYFRHRGNIRFESAMEHPDYWEDWLGWKEELENTFENEKDEFPDWLQPKVSIMAVAYGLRRIGDFTTSLHLLGDHHDGELETTEDDVSPSLL